MRHDLSLEGPAFRLRPIELRDAAFVATRRSDPRAVGTLHPTTGLVADQVDWLNLYFDRRGDWYWIVEGRFDAEPQGALGLWVEEANGRAQWGRWILSPGSLAAAESTLLLYRLAFERLGMSEVYCRTVATNLAVISFHDHAGLHRVGTTPAAFMFGGTPIDAVEHRLRREDWPATRAILELRALQAARLIERGVGR